MNLKTGQQEKFLLIYFAFPGALTQQIGGSGVAWRETRQGWGWSIHAWGVAKVGKPILHIMTTSSMKKKGQGIIINSSLLREVVSRICWPDLAFREVCWLPGAYVKNLPEDFLAWYMVFHVGTNEVAMRSPNVIKIDFRALGRLEKGSGL